MPVSVELNQVLAAREAFAKRGGKPGDEASLGLCFETVRPRGHAPLWRGLSEDDGLLLEAWVDEYYDSISELHTHVACGLCAVEAGVLEQGASPGMVRHLYARKADAVVRFRLGWIIVECKPTADHRALGQLRFYKLHLAKATPELSGARLMVLCTECDEDFREAFVANGIEVCVVSFVGGTGRVTQWDRPSR